MKTSISSKAFCSITDRQTDKIFTEYAHLWGESAPKKLERYLNLGPRKSRFPLNLTDIQTYIQTDRRTNGHLLLLSSFATKKGIELLKKIKYLKNRTSTSTVSVYMVQFIPGYWIVYLPIYIRVIPQGTVDNNLGPDRLAGPKDLDPN